MKKLLIAIAVTIGFGFGFSAKVLAETRYWDIQIMTPAASSSNHTLNVAYNVLSTVETDVYDVSLYQNDVLVGTQHVDHGKGGNSGSFNLTLPHNGTYRYQISAKNMNAEGQTKTTDIKIVQITDGPTPTVTTVSVSTANATGANSAANNTNASSNTTQANSASTGTVTDKAATTSNAGTALGANTNKEKEAAKASTNNKWYVAAGVAALALAGGAYYWFAMRPKLED